MAALTAVIGRALRRSGVRHCFGVVGNGNIALAADLIAAGVGYTSARHEAGAIGMADAYHRVTGEVAVCTTTFGPGFTNATTGLTEAVKHRSGVLMLCGDPPTSGPRSFDVDQAALSASLGARVVRITDPRTAVATCLDALGLARGGPCPIVLLVPSDLLEAEVPEVGAAVPGTPHAAGPHPGPAALDEVAALLTGARNPLLLAGLGAWRSGAGKVIEDLAERLGALLATTVMARGIFDGNPWTVGICGGFAAPSAAELIADADVVVAFGASLGPWTLHHGRMLNPHATLVQVEIGPERTSQRVDVCVSGDAAEVAAALLDRVAAGGAPADSWRARVADRMDGLGWEHVTYDDRGEQGRLDPRTLSRELAGLLPAERTLVTDGGHFVAWPMMYWSVAEPPALVYTGAAFQTIGLGFAGAVGAAVARPDRTTVAVLGDGGALMGLSEMETLIRVAESALVIIYDDAAYGAELHMHGPQAAGTALFGETDFAGVARALGASAVTVRTTEDLLAVRRWREQGARGTFVADCKVVRHVVARILAKWVGA